MSSMDQKRIEDDTYCSPNGSFVWCLPKDYNREKHPFSCKFNPFNQRFSLMKIIWKVLYYFDMINGAHLASITMPWHWLFSCPAQKVKADFGGPVIKSLEAPNWRPWTWCFFDGTKRSPIQAGLLSEWKIGVTYHR